MARLLLFVAWVLGAPSLALRVLAPADAESAGPAMLVFILSPAIAGFVLSRGLKRQESSRSVTQKLAGLALAVGVTLTTILASTLAAVASGALVRGTAGSGVAAAVSSAVVTSTLEELGWAAGGAHHLPRCATRTHCDPDARRGVGVLAPRDRGVCAA